MMRSDNIFMKLYRTLYLFIVLIGLLAASTCKPRSRAEVDQIIGKSETLTRIDRVCQSLRKPDDFVELKKGLFGNSNHSSITYQYKMSRNFDSVVDHFKNECEKTQCIVVNEYNNKNDPSLRTLYLRIEDVGIEIEYRSEFGSIINYGCSD